MLALRQAGYGDRIAVSLGNVPTGVIHNDYSFRGRGHLRKPAGIKSGSKPVKSANELWLSHKDEPAPGGYGSRDKTPNGSIRDENRAGAIVNGAVVNGAPAASRSPRSSNGGSSRDSSTRNGSNRSRGGAKSISFNDAETVLAAKSISFNDAETVLAADGGVVRPSFAQSGGDAGVGRPVARSSLDSDRGASVDASSSGETAAQKPGLHSPPNQNSTNRCVNPNPKPALRHPGSPSRWGAPKPLTSDEVWAANGPAGSPRRSLDGGEQEELARGGGKFRRMASAGENDEVGDGGDGVRERGDSASGSLMGDVEAEARSLVKVGRLDGPKESPESERTGKSRVDVAVDANLPSVLVKPYTETLHPSPKQVVPIAGGDPQSGRKGAI